MSVVDIYATTSYSYERALDKLHKQYGKNMTHKDKACVSILLITVSSL